VDGRRVAEEAQLFFGEEVQQQPRAARPPAPRRQRAAALMEEGTLVPLAEDGVELLLQDGMSTA
jgi:hypothetical protein